MRRLALAAVLTVAAAVSLPAAAIAQVNPVYRQNPVTGDATQQQQITVPSGFGITLQSGASLACNTGSTCPSAAGTVFGPATSTSGNLPAWNNATGTLLNDSGIPAANVPTSSTSGDLTSFSNTTGKLGDSAIPAANFPVSGTVANHIATFNNTTGKIQDGGFALTSIPSGRGAILAASPANPSSTTSTTGVMMGIGSTCHITPSFSTRIELTILGTQGNITAADGAKAQIHYGTGTAPANGAAPTGTSIGGFAEVDSSNSTPFSLSFIVTGLTVGTAYWFDLDGFTPNAGTAQWTNLACTAKEL